LRGDSGIDLMMGDAGADKMFGGANMDYMFTGDGKIVESDGKVDHVNCGGGFDFASVGSSDIVSGCEVFFDAAHNVFLAPSVNVYMGTGSADRIVVTTPNSYVEPGGGADTIIVRVRNVVVNLGVGQWKPDPSVDTVNCNDGLGQTNVIVYESFHDRASGCSGLQM
jgi:hypothetical protein